MFRKALLLLISFSLSGQVLAQEPRLRIATVNRYQIVSETPEYQEMARQYESEQERLQSGNNHDNEAWQAFEAEWQAKTSDFLRRYDKTLQKAAKRWADQQGLDLIVVDDGDLKWCGRDRTDEFQAFLDSMPDSAELKQPVSSSILCLDINEINQSRPFIQARALHDEWAVKRRLEYEKLCAGKSEADREEILKRYSAELDSKEHAAYATLRERAEEIMQYLAATHQSPVVLDKRVVLYGATDKTDQFLKLLQSNETLEWSEPELPESPIAYYDNDVVRSLRIFREARAELAERSEALPQEDEHRQEKLQVLEQQIQGPLRQSLALALDQVAEDESLALIFDVDKILYGGKNVTEEVVDAFLKLLHKPDGAVIDEG